METRDHECGMPMEKSNQNICGVIKSAYRISRKYMYNRKLKEPSNLIHQ